jgi:hypothetical protein
MVAGPLYSFKRCIILPPMFKRYSKEVGEHRSPMLEFADRIVGELEKGVTSAGHNPKRVRGTFKYLADEFSWGALRGARPSNA